MVNDSGSAARRRRNMKHDLRLVVVFGSEGQIGQELMGRTAPSGYALVGLPRPRVDITNEEAVRGAVRQYRPAVLINCAAYTAVDRAESEPEAAFAINAGGARHIAAAARELNATLVHLSTDYVFDGGKPSPYVEDDPVAPGNVYGRSKEAGERAVRDVLDRHLILRTAWVYAAHSHNFLRTMLKLARERDSIHVVADQHGTPTAAADIAQAILAIVPRLDNSEATCGTFHLTNSGRTTWYAFALAIFTILQQRGYRVPSIEAIASADYPTPARRPPMSVLDCSKIERTYGVRLPPWELSLRETLDVLLGIEKKKGTR
jgi:dTDP-4-dehydrorhamnose reductase